MDYYNRYIEQIENKENLEYKKYFDIYFLEDEEFERSVNNGDLVLINLKTKKKIILKKSKYINIFTELNRFKTLKEKLLNDMQNNLNDNVSNFEIIKEELIKVNNNIINIQKILNHKNNSIFSIENEQKQLENELYQLHTKKDYYFNTFKSNVSSDIYNKLKEIYKSEGNIDDVRINIISKQLKVLVKNIKLVFNYFIVSKKYIRLLSRYKNEYLSNKEKINNINNILLKFSLSLDEIVIENLKDIKISKRNVKVNTDDLSKKNIQEDLEEVKNILISKNENTENEEDSDNDEVLDNNEDSDNEDDSDEDSDNEDSNNNLEEDLENEENDEDLENEENDDLDEDSDNEEDSDLENEEEIENDEELENEENDDLNNNSEEDLENDSEDLENEENDDLNNSDDNITIENENNLKGGDINTLLMNLPKSYQKKIKNKNYSNKNYSKNLKVINLTDNAINKIPRNELKTILK